jgi:hypothetical protein
VTAWSFSCSRIIRNFGSTKLELFSCTFSKLQAERAHTHHPRSRLRSFGTCPQGIRLFKISSYLRRTVKPVFFQKLQAEKSLYIFCEADPGGSGLFQGIIQRYRVIWDKSCRTCSFSARNRNIPIIREGPRACPQGFIQDIERRAVQCVLFQDFKLKKNIPIICEVDPGGLGTCSQGIIPDIERRAVQRVLFQDFKLKKNIPIIREADPGDLGAGPQGFIQISSWFGKAMSLKTSLIDQLVFLENFKLRVCTHHVWSGPVVVGGLPSSGCPNYWVLLTADERRPDK